MEARVTRLGAIEMNFTTNKQIKSPDPPNHMKPTLPEKEVYVVDPWLKDDPTKPKVFTLAGFVQNQKVNAQQMKEQKEEIIATIKKLGGTVIERDDWDNKVTHVIAYIDGKKESMSEKVMAALAAGRWVLTKRFIDKSAKKGEWITQPRLFVPNEAVLRNRWVELLCNLFLLLKVSTNGYI